MRYLHPADHHPARISKVDRMFEEELDFTGKKFPVKKIFTKLKKKNSSALSRLVMKTEKNVCFMCQKILSKNMLIYYY